MRLSVVCLVLILTLASTATAQQSTPAFTNGPRVAAAMERHYNGAGYRARLAEADGKVTRRVLCAHDAVLRVVECSGRLRIQGRAVRAAWELEKRTPRRARITWTFTGAGVFQRDSEIVRPGAFGLSRF